MAANRDVEEELFRREMEEIERLPENCEERLIRAERLFQLQIMARLVEEEEPDDNPGLVEEPKPPENNEEKSQEQKQVDIYKTQQQVINDGVMAQMLHEKTIRQEQLRRRRPVASNQARSEAEALAPWLRETRRRADALVIEVTNMINALYHTPPRNSAPEISTRPLAGGRPRPIRGRSSMGEPVYEPQVSTYQEVARNAFYWDIRERMTSVLARAMQFRNSIPLTQAVQPQTPQPQTFPTPESPPLVLVGEQGASFDSQEYSSSLEGAVASAPSQVQTPEDYENNNIIPAEDAPDWRETVNFSSDVKRWSPNPNRRSRTPAVHNENWRRDPFVSRSPVAKDSRSKVPTPRDKKPSEKDSYKKTFKKCTVKKQPEKETPKTPAKKSSRKGSKPSVKESSEKNKAHKKPKGDKSQTSRPEQGMRSASMYGARPKTSAASVWNEAAISTAEWEVSASDPALYVRTPVVEESPSPSTGHTSVANTPMCERTLGNINCADVDNVLPSVNPPVSEFGRSYSSGQFTLRSLPVRERTWGFRHASQAHNAASQDHNAELNIVASKFASSPQSPSINRPLEDIGDVGASGNNETLNIDIDMSTLKLESPQSPRDNIPSRREIGVSNEDRERRIARVRPPSHADLDVRALKLESPSQTRRLVYILARRFREMDEASLDKSTKTTTSSTKSNSASIPKGASSASVRKGASSASVSKGASSASVPKGASSASVPKGASSASVPKGASSASVPKGASSASVPKGAENTKLKKSSTRASKAVSISSVPNDRNRMPSKDGYCSISSKLSPGIPTREIGTSTPAHQISAIREKSASSTPSSKDDSVQRRVASGISRSSKEPPFSLTKKTSCIQSPREVTASKRTASKMASVRIKTTSSQSQDSVSEEVGVPLADSAGIVPQKTCLQSSEATASGKETVASVPFFESADIVSDEATSTQSSVAAASKEETGVPFAESTANVLQEISSTQSSKTVSGEDTSVNVQLVDSDGIVSQETSLAQSSEATTFGKETVASVPFAESADIVSDEATSTQSSVAAASKEETGVPFAESTSNVPQEISSTQSSKTVSRKDTNVQLVDSDGIVSQETSLAQSSEATAFGKETVASVPFAESADIVPDEVTSTQSSEAAASRDETSVQFAKFAGNVPQETSSSQLLQSTALEKETTESASLLPKKTSTQSSMVTKSNNETSVADGASSEVDISKVESSQSSSVDTSENKLEILEPCPIENSSGPAVQTSSVSRKSEPAGRREATESSPRKYHSV